VLQANWNIHNNELHTLAMHPDPFANRFMNIKLQKAMTHTPNYKTELVTYPKNTENTQLHDP
jgi:hypothetical protein